jgi:hypothetical protein
MHIFKRASETGNVPLNKPRSFLYERSYTNFSPTCISSTCCRLHSRGLCGWVDLLQTQIFDCKTCESVWSWISLFAVCTVQYNILHIYYFFLWLFDSSRVMASSILMFLNHTQRRTTVGRTLLDKWSARRRDLYLTTHNIHNKHPCDQWNSNTWSQQASGRRPTP